MKKYKVLETEIRQWNDKQFKVAELEGPAGEVHSNVSVWARLDEVRAGNVIEGDIDASGKGKKFVFPRPNRAGSNRDYEGEEKRRSANIAYLSAMDKSVQICMAMLKERDFSREQVLTRDQVRDKIVDWRDWFLSEYNNYSQKIK